MSEKLKKALKREHIYSTAPRCPFCGGTMLPLSYLADAYGDRCSGAWLYDEVWGELKACDQCGIVKFYPDKKEKNRCLKK